MQIHELKSKNRQNRKPRVGRGGKRGTTAGRGTKGQKSRAGHKIRPAVRDLLQRLPKLRGYANNRKNAPAKAVKLSQIERAGLSDISFETLNKAGLIKKSDKRVKLLFDGDLKGSKLNVSAEIAVSASAKEKIESAGGKVESK